MINKNVDLNVLITPLEEIISFLAEHEATGGGSICTGFVRWLFITYQLFLMKNLREIGVELEIDKDRDMLFGVRVDSYIDSLRKEIARYKKESNTI